MQGDVAWTYAELAAVVADTALILELYDVGPGDLVMIVSENSLALVALILAISELEAWSVVVNRRLSERHDADIAVLRGLGTLGVGPLNCDTMPEPVEADRSRQVAALVYTSGTTGKILKHRLADAGRDRVIGRV